MTIIMCKQTSASVILLYCDAAMKDDVNSISYVKMTYKDTNFHAFSL